MNIEQFLWTQQKGWQPALEKASLKDAQLILIFGSTAVLKLKKDFDVIRRAYPGASFVGCSTAGEICGTQVTDDSLVVTVVQFKKTTLKAVTLNINQAQDSYRIGEELAAKFPTENLVHVFVLSEGLNINGSELVKGITSVLPQKVAATGGLSGDGSNFKEIYDLD